jgi:uncharacterized protein (DUF302 family)
MRAEPMAQAFDGALRGGRAARIGVVLLTRKGADAAMSMTEHPVTIDHVEIHSTQAFDSVAKNLESALPEIDPAIAEALASGDLDAAERRIGKTPLFIFLKRDHGALLRVAGQHRKVFQYEIGNPLTATKMTWHQLQSALYAPLRVTLFENDSGGCTFAYDRPSSLFGQFGDDRVAEVARRLDEELKSALLRSAQ